MRIIGGWISMHGAEEYIVSCVEDRLGTIAMVSVKVDDRNSGKTPPQDHRRNSSIVAGPEASRAIHIGMVARWPAKRKDGTLVVECSFGACYRWVRPGIAGAVSALHHGVGK